MPTYTMKNNVTGEEKEMFLSLSEREAFLNKNKDWTQKLNTPGFVSDTKSTFKRAGDGWKDVLQKVKSGSGKDNTIKY